MVIESNDWVLPHASFQDLFVTMTVPSEGSGRHDLQTPFDARLVFQASSVPY